MILYYVKLFSKYIACIIHCEIVLSMWIELCLWINKRYETFWNNIIYRETQLFFRYAQYSHFKIYSEADYYKLEIDGYEGTAGDSLNDPWYGSNNSPFSTYNRYVSLLTSPQLNCVYFSIWIHCERNIEHRSILFTSTVN